MSRPVLTIVNILPRLHQLPCPIHTCIGRWPITRVPHHTHASVRTVLIALTPNVGKWSTVGAISVSTVRVGSTIFGGDVVHPHKAIPVTCTIISARGKHRTVLCNADILPSIQQFPRAIHACVRSWSSAGLPHHAHAFVWSILVALPPYINEWSAIGTISISTTGIVAAVQVRHMPHRWEFILGVGIEHEEKSSGGCGC